MVAFAMRQARALGLIDLLVNTKSLVRLARWRTRERHEFGIINDRRACDIVRTARLQVS
jgi:hypothetical protein